MRLLTVFAIVLLCGFAALRGGEIIGFVIAQARPAALDDAELRRWRTTPGLVGFAAGVAPAADLPTAGNRPVDLETLLSARPLAGSGWLALAGRRAAAAAPGKQVREALTMSYITAPNDGAVMLPRGIFGLIEWERLDERARDLASRDLAGALDASPVPGSTIAILKGLLAGKPGDVRAQIAVKLRIAQLSTDRFADLGL